MSTTIFVPGDAAALALGADVVATGIAGEAARRYASLGVSTVVVKDGAKGATVLDGDELTPVVASAPREVVDTTAAGDSFAAAFLARLAGGAAAVDAARFAAGVAAEVVAARGALVDIPKSFSG